MNPSKSMNPSKVSGLRSNVLHARWRDSNFRLETLDFKRQTLPYLALAAMLLVPAMAEAQAIVIDPTRPPVGYLATDGEAAEGGGAMLQSVLISPTQRTAIISGVVVKLGEKYGDAVLIRVAESEVVLRSGGANRVLKLYPGVTKREAGQAATGTQRGGASSR
jgi:MSHA biogenesis protein MshK